MKENQEHEDYLKEIKREVLDYEMETRFYKDPYAISEEEIKNVLQNLKNG